MKLTFREFIRSHPFTITFGEEDAAPAMGTPTAPTTPTTNDDSHFDMLKGQLGMEDDDFDAAMSTGSTTIWQVPNYSNKWGFLVAGSVQADVEARPDGNYNVLFHLKDKKLMLPKSFVFYPKGDKLPLNYSGPVEDMTEVMTKNELQKAVALPFRSGGVPAGGMGGGMGGPPGMGGGAPPMGSPAGGSAAPAPTGGAPI